MSFFSRLSRKKSEWLAGVFDLSGELEAEDGVVVHPRVYLVLELPSELLVGTRMVDPRASQPGIGAVVRDSMEKPLAGKPRRPHSIRVTSAVLAVELRAEIGSEIPISIASTPELDDLVAHLEESLEVAMSAPPPPVLLPTIPAALAAELFETAAAFFRAAPWKRIRDNVVLHALLSGYPEPLPGEVHVVASLSDPEHRGLVFMSDSPSKALPQAGTSFFFLRSSDAPEECRDERAREGWPIAAPNAFPIFLTGDRENVSPLTEPEARLLADLGGAFLEFYRTHGERLVSGDREPNELLFTAREGMTIRLTSPIDDEGELETEEVVLAELEELDSQFRESPEFAGLAGEQFGMLVQLGRHAFGMFGLRLTELDEEDVEEVVFELFPAALLFESPQEARKAWREIVAIWEWLAREERTAAAPDVLEMLEGSEEEFVALMFEPEVWGETKMFVMTARAAGVDLHDEAAVEEFAERYQSALASIRSTSHRGGKSAKAKKKNKRKMEKRTRRKNRR